MGFKVQGSGVGGPCGCQDSALIHLVKLGASVSSGVPSYTLNLHSAHCVLLGVLLVDS